MSLSDKFIFNFYRKPENFVIGLGKNKDLIHLIDFGLTKKYCDKKGEHIKYNSSVGMVL